MESNAVPVPEKIYGLIVEMCSDFRAKVNKEYIDVSRWEGPEAVRRIAASDAADRVSASGLLDRLFSESFRIESPEEKELRLNPSMEPEDDEPFLNDHRCADCENPLSDEDFSAGHVICGNCA
jgi:hypothetical protein